MLNIHKKCSTLLQTILLFTENDTVLEESSQAVICELQQAYVSISAQIKSTYVENVLSLSLNTQVLDVVNMFMLCLQDTYSKNYKEECSSRFSISSLKWYLKVFFTDKYVKPFSLALLSQLIILNSRIFKKCFIFWVENFFYTHNSQLCHLDHLFVHKLMLKKWWAFVLVTSLQQQVVNWNNVLDVPLLHSEKAKLTLGLSVIDARRTWVVSITHWKEKIDYSRDETPAMTSLFLYCNWEIHFL